MNRRGLLCGLVATPLSGAVPQYVSDLFDSNPFNERLASWNGGEYLGDVWVEYFYRRCYATGKASWGEYKFESPDVFYTLAYKFSINDRKYGQFFILSEDDVYPGSEHFKTLMDIVRESVERSIGEIRAKSAA